MNYELWQNPIPPGFTLVIDGGNPGTVCPIAVGWQWRPAEFRQPMQKLSGDGKGASDTMGREASAPWNYE